MTPLASLRVLSVSSCASDLVRVMALVGVELSEPYSVFTYRYFINNWRHLCFLVRRDAQAPERGPDEGFQAFVDERCVGAVVCKLDAHRGTRRGYLAMLVVEKEYRKLRIGAPLGEAAQAKICLTT